MTVPLFAGQRFHEGAMTAIASSASANTKGSYVELVNSTPFAGELEVEFVADASAVRSGLLDIAIGAASSEQIIASNVLVSVAPNVYPIYALPLGLWLPSGTRISGRYQASTGNTTLAGVAARIIGRGASQRGPLGMASTYGANTGTSGGVSIDPGGVADTKGSWVQIAASTSRQIRRLLILIGNQANTIRTFASWKLDIGVGSGGSEQIVVPDRWLQVHTSGDAVMPCVHVAELDIPIGTRLAARASCTITDATDRLIDVALVGVG